MGAWWCWMVEDDKDGFLGVIGAISQVPARAASKATLGSTTTSRQAGEVMWREVAIPAVRGRLEDEKRGNSLLLVL